MECPVLGVWILRDSPLIKIFQTWQNVIIWPFPPQLGWDHVYYYYVTIHQVSFCVMLSGQEKSYPMIAKP